MERSPSILLDIRRGGLSSLYHEEDTVCLRPGYGLVKAWLRLGFSECLAKALIRLRSGFGSVALAKP